MFRFLRGCARGALLASGIWLAGAAASEGRGPAHCAETITGAAFAGETTRYPHGVLGDDVEWQRLNLSYQATLECRHGSGGLNVQLPEELVFEDVAPRLIDLDGSGHPEVVVVESHQNKGARLAVWGIQGDQFKRITATPFIGQRFRWLAPLGAADLDGDGVMELAYVDRPHLAKTLRIWRYEADGDTVRLREVAALKGVTNHRIGERDIAGGIRDCGQGTEMIVADASWREVLAVSFDGTKLSQQPLGRHQGRKSFARAMSCRAVK